MPNKKDVPRKRRRRLGLVAACLALVLACGGGGLFYQQAHAVAAVVSLDVNPSIELRINQGERVLSCVALNEEAAAVMADMDGGRDLEGAKLDVAVNALVGALVRSGYLDRLDAALLISVEDKDAARGARLQQELETTVGALLQSSSSQATVMGQSLTVDAGLEAQARENNISTGKAYLVEQVAAMNGALAFDQLAALSVEELRDMQQTGARQMPIGKAAAAAAAESWAGTTAVDSVTVEVDPELDEAVPCYEVEVRTPWGEYEYTIDAYTGAVLSGTPDIVSAGPGAAPPDEDDLDDADDTDDLDDMDDVDGPDDPDDVDGPDDPDDMDDADDADDMDDVDDADDPDDDDDVRPAAAAAPKATAKPASVPKATAKPAAAPAQSVHQDSDDNDDDGDDDDDDDSPPAVPVQSKPAQGSQPSQSGGKTSRPADDDDDDDGDDDDDDD